MTRYGRRELVEAYLGSRGWVPSDTGYYEDEEPYNDALKAYERSRLAVLERLFGLELPVLPPSKPDDDITRLLLLRLLVHTASSCLSATTPTAYYLDATLLIRRLQAQGAHGARALAARDRIDKLHRQYRAEHVEMLDAIVAVLLGDRADSSFTSEDLLAAGFDDRQRPSLSDF